MATPFSNLMARATEEPGKATVDVPQDWMQGRSVFGGLQIALALRAMRTLVPETPLRTLQATFFAPVPGGRMTAHANVVRSGKNTAHVEARLVDGTATLALAVGVFGTARASRVAVTPVQQAVEAGEGVEMAFGPGMLPDFTQHFTARWLRGSPPFTADTACEHVIEVGIRDEGFATEGHLIAIADFIPPMALSHLDAPAPGSTVTWMMELLIDRVDHLPLGRWRVDAELVAARDGYTSQSVMVWGPGGVPVALSRQSMLVFA